MRRPGSRWGGAVERPSVFRPDISQVAADRAGVVRCRWSLALAVGRCCCCHRCCQLGAGRPGARGLAPCRGWPASGPGRLPPSTAGRVLNSRVSQYLTLRSRVGRVFCRPRMVSWGWNVGLFVWMVRIGPIMPEFSIWTRTKAYEGRSPSCREHVTWTVRQRYCLSRWRVIRNSPRGSVHGSKQACADGH